MVVVGLIVVVDVAVVLVVVGPVVVVEVGVVVVVDVLVDVGPSVVAPLPHAATTTANAAVATDTAVRMSARAEPRHGSGFGTAVESDTVDHLSVCSTATGPDRGIRHRPMSSPTGVDLAIRRVSITVDGV